MIFLSIWVGVCSWEIIDRENKIKEGFGGEFERESLKLQREIKDLQGRRSGGETCMGNHTYITTW